MKLSKEVHCSLCGSTETHKNKLSGMGAFIGMITLGIPVPWITVSLHCFDCNRDFKLKRSALR